MTVFEPVSDRKVVGWQATAFCLWLAITGIGLVLKPDPAGHGTHQELGLPPCPSALFLDRPCPGCGLTTSWTALLHGDFHAAFVAHPLGPILYLAFTWLAWWGLFGFVKRRRLVLDSIAMSRLLTACAMVFLAFGLYRMATTPNYRTAAESSILTRTAQKEL